MERIYHFILEPLRAAENESRQFLAGVDSRRVDSKIVIVLISTACILTLLHFLGMQEGYALIAPWLDWLGLESWSQRLVETMRDVPHAHFHRLIWWVCWCMALYMLMPATIITLVFREPLKNFGIRSPGGSHSASIYVILFMIMAPLVFIISGQERFLETYPFYKLGSAKELGARFVCWEILYASQFIALEFFFRGFLLHGLRHRFGAYSILIMVIPYCMIHFTKPLLECGASILAGLMLGFLSLKTRSVWLGAALHISVAWWMDFLALWRKGMLNF